MDASESNVWDCQIAFNMTKHCGSEKEIQFVKKLSNMKHSWNEICLDIDGKPVGKRCVMLHRWRVCKNCGAKQMYDAEYSWMRVVGYRWTPKAGRCRLKEKQNETTGV